MSTPEENLKQFVRCCGFGQDVFREKNKKYGNAIDETGLLGAVVELVGTSARLKELVLHQDIQGIGNNIRAIMDVLIDTHNYASIAMLMAMKGNYNGLYTESREPTPSSDGNREWWENISRGVRQGNQCED